jgi:FAD/FMN-containing dehydrogenase
MSLDLQPTTPSASSSARAAALQDVCGDTLVALPGDPAYDSGRAAWNSAVDQWPAAVATPRSASEVQTVVRAAAEHGLRVAPQATGHAAAVLAQHDLSSTVLVRMHQLDLVEIDPGRRVARLGGGVLWQSVVAAAAEHGLAAQHGSAPDVGAVGYLLGGGLGWYARKHGLAVNDVLSVQLVTADGTLVSVDADHEPELFWAVRGGGANVGIVVELELRLHAVTDAYAGMLVWGLDRLEPVLRQWVDWAVDAPEEATTSLRVMRFPPIPELPDFLRGRAVVILDGAVLTDDAEAERILAGFRALAPEVDTFGRVPAASLSRLHMDPEQPTPSVGAGTTLWELDEEGVGAFVDAVGPDSDTSLFLAELRQLGGAVGRPAPGGGALSRLDAAYLVLFLAIAPDDRAAAEGRLEAQRALSALSAWDTGRPFLNLVERPVDPGTAFGSDTYLRLRELRCRWDPRGVLLANHEVPAE